MEVKIRKFIKEDIANKVKWINDPENNRYLHYDLPLEYEKTYAWFERVQNQKDRYDAVILADNIPVGLIGLLSIDYQNLKAEYYISMGETEFKGQGVASRATKLLLEYAFCELRLEKIYLYTESSNIAAQKMFERVGFRKEGVLKRDIIYRGKYIDRIEYGITKSEYVFSKGMTPVTRLDDETGNRIFIKRDDLIPFSFGGNKARKAFLFFQEIDSGDYDCVVTYGSSSSNHCRVVSNMAAMRDMPCYIIGPQEASVSTFNSQMMALFGAEIALVPVDGVHDAIEDKLEGLKAAGKKPYFIPGGGHGNLGTQAYVDCYEEIREYERETGIHFDYIFHASGTGTTQAGLICGQLLHGDERKIIGVSIARKNPRGREVVLASVKEYLDEKQTAYDEAQIEESTIFIDDYTGNGYGNGNPEIEENIKELLTRHGIPTDSTYTGKAYTGMKKYIEKQHIGNKNILFIHTGGTPLFFDNLRALQERAIGK